MANPGSEHPEHSEESSLKEKIFQSAIALFAEYGLNGARMEQIAEKAGTTKRMVVYHFKNKENLYLLVLEHVYTQIRASEKALSLTGMPPVEALVNLVEATFDYHADHPDYIRIICMENMQRGRFMQQSSYLRQVNRSALDLLEGILLRGKESGRADDASEEVIRDRIKVYHEQTAIVADFYAKQGKFADINGLGTMDEVFDRICQVIDSIRK